MELRREVVDITEELRSEIARREKVVAMCKAKEDQIQNLEQLNRQINDQNR